MSRLRAVFHVTSPDGDITLDSDQLRELVVTNVLQRRDSDRPLQGVGKMLAFIRKAGVGQYIDWGGASFRRMF